MLIPPKSQAPDTFMHSNRALDVLALGLTYRSGNCPAVPLDPTVPYPVAVEIAQAQSPAAQVAQSSPSALSPATVTEGQSGATFSSADLTGAPTVVPMNATPEMVIQHNPAALRQRRNRKREASSRTTASSRTPGVNWGQSPAVQPGSTCGPAAGSLMAQLQANPLAALLIASGLGVIVYAAVKK